MPGLEKKKVHATFYRHQIRVIRPTLEKEKSSKLTIWDLFLSHFSKKLIRPTVGEYQFAEDFSNK